MAKTQANATAALPAGPKGSSKNDELTRQRQAAIAEGALKIFLDKGFHPTTIREIATACGMSMGQLYHYISSKDDILFLVHRQEAERFLAELSQAIDGVAEPKARLIAALEAAQQLALREQRMLHFIMTESKYLDAEHQRALAETGRATTRKFWHDLLADVQQVEPLACDLQQAANFINYATTLPAWPGWNERRGNRRFLVDFICRGLGLPV